MAKSPPPRGTPSAPPVPPDQLPLPVSFDPAGRAVTLREALTPGYGTVTPFSSLTLEQRIKLTVTRIEAQPKFDLGMIGGGRIDKPRAIREVLAQTDVGKNLVEIEQRVIAHLLSLAVGP